jgi:hypothetical protein
MNLASLTGHDLAEFAKRFPLASEWLQSLCLEHLINAAQSQRLSTIADTEPRGAPLTAHPNGSAAIPQVCYVFVPENRPGRRIGLVQRGADGYHDCPLDSVEFEAARASDLVCYLNSKLGVTTAQASAMLTGAIFGWDAPAADCERPVDRRQAAA